MKGESVEVVNAAWLSVVVDRGRLGFADVGVPRSSGLDRLALGALNYLLGNPPSAPAIEVAGNEFHLKFHCPVSCAVTGAIVEAFLDGAPVPAWTVFAAREGSLLRVGRVLEGYRYYIGFSASVDLPLVMGSAATNIECRFGGFKGRPLMKGDRIGLCGLQTVAERSIEPRLIPTMAPPHVLRLLAGPEADRFTEASLRRFWNIEENGWYLVSARSNRTGIRMSGEKLLFRPGVEESITSEGVLPGTVQAPPDGDPIILLYERTTGGYARVAVVVNADLDRLAHVKPRDRVMFEVVTRDEALELSRAKARLYDFLAPFLS